MFKPSLNVLGKIQTSTGNLNKIYTIRNNLSTKESVEENKDKVPANSPLSHPSSKNPHASDKSLKNKLTMMNFGKTKFINKGNRNSNMKPPKKCFTITSNKNSDSESSFTSMNTLGFKNFGQEYATPSNMIRGSFEVKSTADILHNTAQTIGRNKEGYDNFNPSFNVTLDVRDGSMHELCHKSKYLI